jgi:YD repeat-containing protein
VAAITDGRGLTTRYTYDQLGRVARSSYVGQTTRSDYYVVSEPGT